MSFGKQFSEDLGAGMAFGAAIGAARRINEQDQAIERLIRDYNELVERFNVLLEQRNEALRERDGYKCSVIAPPGGRELAGGAAPGLRMG
jgi:hypothetical protein